MSQSTLLFIDAGVCSGASDIAVTAGVVGC